MNSRLLLLCLFSAATVSPVVAEVPTTVMQTITLPASSTSYARFGRVVTVDGQLAVVSDEPRNHVDGNRSTVRVFDVQSGALLSTLTAGADASEANGFGSSVAISGTRVVVGAREADVAYVYDLAADDKPSFPKWKVHGGYAVSIDGMKVSTTSMDEASGNGVLRAFDLTGLDYDGSLTPLTPLAAISGSGGFGASVTISGSRVAVGAHLDDTGVADAGSVKMFDLSSPTPEVPTLSLPNPEPTAGAHFGARVGMSGGQLVVGAPDSSLGAAGAGRAWVYDLDGGTPATPVVTLNKSVMAEGDRFGSVVSISGSMAMIGAGGDDFGATDAGRAFVYDLAGATPATPVLVLANPAPAPGEHFGEAAAIAGDWCVVGAPDDATNNVAAGVAYTYRRTAPTPSAPVAVLSGPVTFSAPSAVALSGSLLVVGGDHDGSYGSNAGSAFVYDLAGASPTAPLYSLHNPTPDSDYGDYFGAHVAIDGSTVVCTTSHAVDNAVRVYDLAGPTPETSVLAWTPGDPDSISLSGNILAVGMGGLVSAKVYDLASATPTVPLLSIPDETDNEDTAVAVSGRRIAVATGDSPGGSPGDLRVYDLDSATPETPLLSVILPGADWPNLRVAISGSRIAVAAQNQSPVVVYDLASATPSTPVLTLSRTEGGGLSLSFSGDILAVGSSIDAQVKLYDLGGATPATPVAVLDNPPSPAPDNHNVSIFIGTEVALSGSSLATTALGTREYERTYVFGTEPPVAVAGGPYQGVSGQPLTLDGSGSHHPVEGRAIVSYAWDLDGDQAFDDATGATPTLTAVQFARLGLSVGDHTIFLRVIDSNGASGVASATLTVEDGINAARFTVTPNPAEPAQALVFDASSSVDPTGHNFVNYAWDFGDGTYANGVNVQHTYAHFGSYAAILTVTNDDSPAVSDAQMHVVTVNLGNHAPIPASGGPYTIDEGEPFVLDGSASSDADGAFGDSIMSYRWDLDDDGDFDDATGATIPMPVEAQNAAGIVSPGVHPVHLQVTDSLGLASTSSTTVTVALEPLPNSVQHAVALGDGFAVVGAPGEQAAGAPSAYGAAHVLAWDGVAWSEQAQPQPSNPEWAGMFGRAVAISGDTMVVGAPTESSAASGIDGSDAGAPGAIEAGAVYVFTRNGAAWTQQALIKQAQPGVGDHFGAAVMIADDLLMVGAPDEDSNATGLDGSETDNSATNSGAVYLFTRSGTTWSQTAYLKASNTGAGDRFGTALGFSGGVLAVGAPGEDGASQAVNYSPQDNSAPDAGAAYVFRLNPDGWAQEAYLKAGNTGTFDAFGSSVAISGARLVVGAPGEDSGSTAVNGGAGAEADNTSADRGAAYVFIFDGSNWSRESYVKAPDGATGDRFGAHVAFSRGRMVIGAPAHDGALADSGKAYAFEDGGTGWESTRQYAADTERPNDLFGGVVAIRNEVTAFGAAGDSRGSPHAPLASGGVTLSSDAGWAANAPPAPNMRTRVETGADLTMTDPAIVSEVALDGGEYLFEFTHNLANNGTGLWRETGSAVKRAVGDVAFHLLKTETQLAAALAAGENVRGTAQTAMHVVVNATDEAEFTALIAANQLMQASVKNGLGRAVAQAGAVVENGRVLAVRTLPSGQKLIEFTADIRNTGANPFADVALQLDAAATATPSSTLPGGLVFPGTLHPGGTVASSGTAFVMCDAAHVAAARAALADGSAIAPQGEDVVLIGEPTFAFDAAAQAAFSASSSANATTATLDFTRTPTLDQIEVGDILAADESGQRYFNHFTPIPAGSGVLRDFLPIRVKKIATDGIRVTYTGERVNLFNIAESGTFTGDALSGYHAPVRDPYAPPFGYTHTAAEKAAREAQAVIIAEADPYDGRLADLRGFDAIPFHFNDFTLPGQPHVRLSGEVLVSAVPFHFQITKRAGDATRVTVHSELSVETNLVLECDTGIGVEFSEETDLFPPIPLPIIPIGEFATVQPHIFGHIGASVHIPEKLTLPLQSSITKGMDVIWDIGSPATVETFSESVPLKVSDPGVFQDYQADASAWAEIGVEFEIHPAMPDIASISATLSGKVIGSVNLAPLANPWWNVNLGLDLAGKVGLALDLGIAEVPVAEETPFSKHFDLASFDAGGPLIGGGAMKPKGPTVPGTEPVRPLSGKTVRWARTVAPNTTNPWNLAGMSNTIRLTDGTTVCIWNRGCFGRFSAEGELVWMKPLGGIVGGVALDDNTFTLFQSNAGVVLWHFDADGNIHWVKKHQTTLVPICGAGRQVPDGLGGMKWEYFVAGRGGTPNGVLAFSMAKFDSAGDAVWIKAYDCGDSYDWIAETRVLADNHLILVGSTGYTVGTNPYKKGLLMKVNGDTGAPLWATALLSTGGFTSVAEAPDGNLFTLTGGNPIVTRPYPPIGVARFSPSGVNTGFVQIGLDNDYTDPDVPGPGGASGGQIRWANGALWACGYLWNTPNESWVMRLNEKLAVSSFVGFVNDTGTIQLLGLGVQPDGIVVTGHTDGGYPWPGGGTDYPVVLKLPWEGIMRFREESPLHSQFRRPRVYRAADHGDFISNGLSWVQTTPTASDLSITPAAPPWVLPASYGNPLSVPLERKDPAAIGSYEQWAYYHQLPAPNGPGSDSDGDGIANGIEAWFGLDPHAASPPPLTMRMETIGGERLPVLELERASYAGKLGFDLHTSTDLATWSPLPAGFTIETTPLGDDRESVWIYGSPPDPQRFFRLNAAADP